MESEEWRRRERPAHTAASGRRSPTRRGQERLCALRGKYWCSSRRTCTREGGHNSWSCTPSSRYSAAGSYSSRRKSGGGYRLPNLKHRLFLPAAHESDEYRRLGAALKACSSEQVQRHEGDVRTLPGRLRGGAGPPALLPSSRLCRVRHPARVASQAGAELAAARRGTDGKVDGGQTRRVRAGRLADPIDHLRDRSRTRGESDLTLPKILASFPSTSTSAAGQSTTKRGGCGAERPLSRPLLASSTKPASEAATRILAAYIMKVASEAWRIGSPPTTHQNRRSRGGEGSRKALDQPAARPMPIRGLDAAGR